MSVRSLLQVTAVSTLLIAATLAAACGGTKDKLTLDEYFPEVAAAFAEADERMASAQGSGLADPSFDELFDVVMELTEQIQLIINDFVATLDDLDPPAEVADAHDEWLDSMREASGVYEELAAQVNAAEVVSDIEALFTDPNVISVNERADGACLAVQAIADENEVDVDVGCTSR